MGLNSVQEFINNEKAVNALSKHRKLTGIDYKEVKCLTHTQKINSKQSG